MILDGSLLQADNVILLVPIHSSAFLPLDNTFLGNKEIVTGVPAVAQWLTNPTRNHEVAGSVPGLAQRIKDPVLP